MAGRITLGTILALGILMSAAGTRAQTIDVVSDGGFEAGPQGGSWTEFSTNFGTPICDSATCGAGPARTGTFWVWLGGIDANETASVSQTLTIPVSATATLRFWLAIPDADWSGTDTFRVSLDGVLLFATNNFDPQANNPLYIYHAFDVSPFANGSVHTLRFEGQFTSVGTGVTSFYLDDVSLIVDAAPSVPVLNFGALFLLVVFITCMSTSMLMRHPGTGLPPRPRA